MAESIASQGGIVQNSGFFVTLSGDVVQNSGIVTLSDSVICSCSVEEKGFTLMEVVVAMVLVSMVTLVATLGFRLAVRAWERGEEEGNSRQISTSVPALLQRQLDSVEKTVFFGKGGKKVLPFSGSENGISFFTSYAPEGSSIQGLIRVTYVFDKEKTRLAVFEKAITRLKDMDENHNPLSEKWDDETKPVSIIDHIENFSVVFLKKINNDNDKSSFDNVEWKTTWGKDDHGFPGFVKLMLEQKNKGPVQKWYFEVGFG